MKYITYRADRNVYQVKIRANGKTIVKTAKTENDAITIRQELITLYNLNPVSCISLNTNQEKSVPTFKDAFDEFVKVKKEPVLSPSSLYKYLECKRIYYPILGTKKINEIDAENWQRIILSVQESRDLSYNYTKIHKNFIKAMYKYFISLKAVELNPVEHIIINETETEDKRAFTRAEKHIFLNYAKQYEYKFFFMFNMLFETGMRRGELLALRWQDINFDNKYISIRHSISKGIVDGEYTEFLGKTKTKASVRDIPVSSKILMLLRLKYKSTHARQDDFVFTSVRGNSKYEFVSLSRITDAFAKIRLEAHLADDLTIHSIRHYFAEKLLFAGVNIKTIQDICGWSSPDMLFKIYAKANLTEKRKALKEHVF